MNVIRHTYLWFYDWRYDDDPIFLRSVTWRSYSGIWHDEPILRKMTWRSYSEEVWDGDHTLECVWQVKECIKFLQHVHVWIYEQLNHERQDEIPLLRGMWPDEIPLPWSHEARWNPFELEARGQNEIPPIRGMSKLAS